MSKIFVVVNTVALSNVERRQFSNASNVSKNRYAITISIAHIKAIVSLVLRGRHQTCVMTALLIEQSLHLLRDINSPST